MGQIDISLLADTIHEAGLQLTFTIMEVGAAPLRGAEEPFHQLVELFPGSRIIAFEVDEEFCREFNENARPGITMYPVALGTTEEERPFYITNHPTCASLYKPNEKLIRRYNNMEVAYLKSISTIKTQSADTFAAQNDIGDVDFIKIDVQGAELDVFKGALQTLRTVMAIVSEVEFVLHYEHQPLFGDVCRFLAEQQLTFHKFLYMGSRALRPIVLDNNPNVGSQQIWADALYLRDIGELGSLNDPQLLKIAVIALIYQSVDVVVFYLKEYDRRRGTRLTDTFASKTGNPRRRRRHS